MKIFIFLPCINETVNYALSDIQDNESRINENQIKQSYKKITGLD